MFLWKICETTVSASQILEKCKKKFLINNEDKQYFSNWQQKR